MNWMRNKVIGLLPPPIFNAMRRGRQKYLSWRDNVRFLAALEKQDRRHFESVQAAETLTGSAHCVRKGTVVLASTGIANIGDQAMLDAALSAVPGPVTVVMREDATYTINRSDVQVVRDSASVYGRGSKRESAVRKLARLLFSASHFCIIGADIVDGGYQRGVAFKTWSLAHAAAATGIDTRVLGFSWGNNVDPIVSRIAGTAVRSGVRAMCRDSISHERFTTDTQESAELVADIVFTLPETAEQSQRATANNLALVNVSGLISSRVDLRGDYVVACKALHDMGRRLLFIPHVANSGGDDRRAITLVTEALDREGIPYETLPELLSPEEVSALVRQADLVLTGRMHLSILSLKAGTPAMVLATQGKVEGLLHDAGLPWMLVEPQLGMGEHIRTVLDKLVAERAEVDSILSTTVPGLKERAQGNFRGLG